MSGIDSVIVFILIISDLVCFSAFALGHLVTLIVFTCLVPSWTAFFFLDLALLNLVPKTHVGFLLLKLYFGSLLFEGCELEFHSPLLEFFFLFVCCFQIFVVLHLLKQELLIFDHL